MMYFALLVESSFNLTGFAIRGRMSLCLIERPDRIKILT